MLSVVYLRKLSDEQLAALDVLGQQDLPLAASMEWRHVMHALSADEKASQAAEAPHSGTAQIVACCSQQRSLESAPPAPEAASPTDHQLPTMADPSANVPSAHALLAAFAAPVSDGSGTAQAAVDGAGTSNVTARTAEAVLPPPLVAPGGAKSGSKRVSFADQHQRPEPKRMTTRSSAN